MGEEVRRLVGADAHERTDDRTTHRNGYRERRFDTRMRSVDLAIPKLRKGSDCPSFIESRCRSQEASVNGVSTRKVKDLLQALGVDGITKSEVSRICTALDAQVEVFRNRPLSKAYP